MTDDTIYRVCAAFDTETTNICIDGEWRAFPVLYIVNDFRRISLRDYVPDDEREKVHFFRAENEVHEFIKDLIRWGKERGVVPIIAAYNAMFDLQTIRHELSKRWEVSTMARSSANIYTCDLMEGGSVVCRFWDTFHLEMGGLRSMGRTCGFDKLTSDEWDYSLVRTPGTPLSECELLYAKRDVQVIPAYLRYLVDSHEWLEPRMLGSVVLTKTSLVRQMAKRTVGRLVFPKKNGKPLKLAFMFAKLCAREMPRDFATHALRVACFRGGFTFTAAKFASVVMQNVASFDVTSMHHTFIAGRFIPVDFRPLTEDMLNVYIDRVIKTPREAVLQTYDAPFSHALHARIEFTNLRLRAGSAFGEWHIGLLSEAKFKRENPQGRTLDERSRLADRANRMGGWVDRAWGAVFAFGKLMSAERAVVHVNEVELWALSRVYEWESVNGILGEGTIKFRRPPDFIVLQSCMLFEMKSAAKHLCESYEEGTPFADEISPLIPDDLTKKAKTGDLSEQFLRSWYSSTVKGMFNGIYGTQAQNIYKPDYQVLEGEWVVDRESVLTAETWEELKKEECNVLYTYGERIVGGSRMHLALAIELMHEQFGERALVLGGDTDSLKIALDGVEPDDVLAALSPLHTACRKGLDRCLAKPIELWPDIASNLEHVGEFEYEHTYDEHMEAWNKARISVSGGKVSVTCAGLSRPEGAFTVEDWGEQMLQNGWTFEEVAHAVLGYNVTIAPEVSHALQRTHPKANARFISEVTDHTGGATLVDAHEAIALYPLARELGSLDQLTNFQSERYIRRMFDRILDTERTYVRLNEGRADHARESDLL